MEPSVVGLAVTVGTGCLAAAALVVSGVAGAVLLAVLALALGPVAAWWFDRVLPVGVEVTVGSTRVRARWVGSLTTRTTDVVLAHLVGAETRDEGLFLSTDGGRVVIALPGQRRARVRALEDLIESTRDRMNERAGRERDVPDELRGLRPPEPG